MQHFKQRAKKWLSGFLAAVMLFGMLPSMGLFNPAYAAGGATTPPVTIKNTTRDVKYGKIEGRNPITGELIMNVPGHTSVIPRLFEFVGDDGSEVPGFCADHKLNFDGKVVPSLTWKNPVPVVGSKYEKVLPIVANFMVSYKQAEWMADQLSGMGDMTEAELDEWCAANAQGYYPGDLSWSHYSYWGQKGSGDWTWNYKVTNMGAQAAIWLAGADLLSPGPTLTDEDLEKIAGLQMLTLYEMYGKGQGWKLTKESAEGVPGNPGWYAEGVSLRVGWYKSAVERYNRTKCQYEEFTPGMEFYLYTPYKGDNPHSSTQPIIIPVFTPGTGRKSGWIAVKKVDGEGNSLAGAEFGVYEHKAQADAGLTPGKKITTDASGYGAVEVAWQSATEEVTFWVKELKAPSHPDEPNKFYKPDSSVIPVTVSSVSNATEATAAFARGISGWVNHEDGDSEHSEIKKVDASGNGIGIAKFNIRSITLGVDKDVETDASGNVPMQWTNPAGANYYEPGEYTVTEIVAPTGYERDPQSQNLRLWVEEIDGVKVGMSSGPITFVNHEKHRIVIEKVGPNGGLPGAVFEVYFNNQKIDEITTGADGTFSYEGVDGNGLQSGDYTFKEIKAPPGYLLPIKNREQTVSVDTSDGTVTRHTLVFENYMYPEIRIRKVRTGSNLGLPGATFEVKINETSIGDFTSGEGGWVIIPWSVYGKFMGDGADNDSFSVSVRETVAPENFLIDDTSWHTQMFTKGETAKEFVFEDEEPTTIIIKKVSANTDEPLAGATFEVEIEGESLGTFGPTEEDGTIKIHYETYGRFLRDETRDQWTVRVREVTPPAGYLISDKSWHTEILHRGEKEKQFVFEDAKYPEILIAKKDKETGAYLPNATFDIKIDGTNFQSQKTTNEDGIIRITYDEYGEFLPDIDKSGKEWTVTVTEVKAPDGYNKDKQGSGDYTQTQSLKFDQSVTEFIFEDTSYRNIKVRKIDSKTGWPLMGAEFRLSSVTLDEAGSYDETQTTDASGYAYFEKVPNGTYNLTETQPPFGYDPDVYWTDGKPAVRTVIVSSGDPVWVDFEAKNDPLPGLRIRKVDSVTQQPIKDALFRIEPLAPLQGSVIERTTDGNGEIVLQDLPTGSYRITEISVPKPYIVNSTPQIVAIDNQHDDYTVTFPNNAEGILYILKRDAETDEPLAGAWFSITKADGTAVADVGPTGPNGYTSLTGLQPGSYVVKETRAPDGHVIDGESKTFEVKAEDSGKVYVLIFDNHSKPEMWLRKVDANTGVGLEGAK